MKTFKQVFVLIGFLNVLVSSEKSWWENAVFYQIYPRSFKDSNGDGIGDIRGVISKLDYLADTGINGLWLSPVFKSPQIDSGYDIADYTQVDPIFGTNDDFIELFIKGKELGIKIILDFVPNHTSDQHEWFLKSIERDPEYEDYYMWADKAGDDVDGTPIRPNNWQSSFYGPAWTWNDKREQFYLHQYDRRQPDLNYRNPKVVQAMKDVLTFWLKLGADGFRIDAITRLFEIETLDDEPVTGRTNDPNDYGFTHHIYTRNLNETYDMVYQWRELVDQYRLDNGGDEILLMTEAYASLEDTKRYYGAGDRLGSQIPFNFVLVNRLDSSKTAVDFHRVIHSWVDILTPEQVPNWVLGNHDRPRSASHYGENMVNVLHTLTMMLPGIAITYNGEEIGMLDNNDITWEQTQDPRACNRGDSKNFRLKSRDPARTPFQWDNTMNAGFTDGPTTWLPVHPNYERLNLKNQLASESSVYQYYRKLVKLKRGDPVFAYGGFRSTVLKSSLVFVRSYENVGAYVIVLNMADNFETINLSDFLAEFSVTNLTIQLAGPQSNHFVGEVLPVKNITLGPYDSIVFKVYSQVIRMKKNSMKTGIYDLYINLFLMKC